MMSEVEVMLLRIMQYNCQAELFASTHLGRRPAYKHGHYTLSHLFLLLQNVILLSLILHRESWFLLLL